jgi:hypothetical protein
MIDSVNSDKNQIGSTFQASLQADADVTAAAESLSEDGSVFWRRAANHERLSPV